MATNLFAGEAVRGGGCPARRYSLSLSRFSSSSLGVSCGCRCHLARGRCSSSRIHGSGFLVGLDVLDRRASFSIFPGLLSFCFCFLAGVAPEWLVTAFPCPFRDGKFDSTKDGLQEVAILFFQASSFGLHVLIFFLIFYPVDMKRNRGLAFCILGSRSVNQCISKPKMGGPDQSTENS